MAIFSCNSKWILFLSFPRQASLNWRGKNSSSGHWNMLRESELESRRRRSSSISSSISSISRLTLFISVLFLKWSTGSRRRSPADLPQRSTAPVASKVRHQVDSWPAKQLQDYSGVCHSIRHSRIHTTPPLLCRTQTSRYPLPYHRALLVEISYLIACGSRGVQVECELQICRVYMHLNCNEK